MGCISSNSPEESNYPNNGNQKKNIQHPFQRNGDGKYWNNYQQPYKLTVQQNRNPKINKMIQRNRMLWEREQQIKQARKNSLEKQPKKKNLQKNRPVSQQKRGKGNKQEVYNKKGIKKINKQWENQQQKEQLHKLMILQEKFEREGIQNNSDIEKFIIANNGPSKKKIQQSRQQMLQEQKRSKEMKQQAILQQQKRQKKNKQQAINQQVIEKNKMLWEKEQQRKELRRLIQLQQQFDNERDLEIAMKREVDLENQTCSMCLMGDLDVFTPCKHFFHRLCIENWLKKDKSCPFCRKQLKKKDLIEM